MMWHNFFLITALMIFFLTVVKRRGGVSDFLPLLTESISYVYTLLNINGENIKTGLRIRME